MQTDELITVREYLATSYRPDCDYVDGAVVERNSGERDHAELQGAVFAYFYNRRKEWGIHVFPEQRVQLSTTRFRIPDVCVILGLKPEELIFTHPPFICVEVLSREDRLSDMAKRAGDFVSMGVPYVFMLDPRTREAWRVTNQGLVPVAELRTENPEMVVPLEALFE